MVLLIEFFPRQNQNALMGKMIIGGSILVQVKNVLPKSSSQEDSAADTQHRTCMNLYNVKIKERYRTFLSLLQWQYMPQLHFSPQLPGI